MKVGDTVEYIGASSPALLQGTRGVIEGFGPGDNELMVTFHDGQVPFQVEFNQVEFNQVKRVITVEHPVSSTGAQREKFETLPYDLIPFQEFADAFVRVAEFGAKKYDAWNWSKGLSRVQLIGSLLRHTFAYLRGEERDVDSGLLHTDHIVWNAVVLVHNVHHDLEDGRRIEPKRDYHK